MISTSYTNKSKVAIAVLVIMLLGSVVLFAGAGDSNAEAQEFPVADESGIVTISVSGEYTLDADMNYSIVIDNGVSVTLDLAGSTITNTSGSHTIYNKGTLVVIDSSDSKTGVVDNISNGKAPLYNEVGAVAELRGGEFTRSLETGADPDNGGDNSYYAILNHGTLSVYDGVRVIQSGHFSSLVDNGWVDGTQNTTGALSIMTVYGGYFSGGINTIKNDDYSKLTIYDGTFTNATQTVVMNYNYATINGGSFELSEDDFDTQSGLISNTYLNSTMDNGILSITGGSFTCPSGVPMFITNGNIGKISITGGSYPQDVTSYIPDGYASAEVNGRHVVAQIAMPDESGVTTVDTPDTIIGTQNSSASVILSGGSISITSDAGVPLEKVYLSIVDQDAPAVAPTAVATYDITISAPNDMRYTAYITVHAEVPAGKVPAVYYIDDNNNNRLVPVDVVSYTSDTVTFRTTHNTLFTITPEDPPASVPSDDDDSLPPFIPQQTAGDDNTTLYIACCAAAAVVALLAIIIVMGERKR